MESPAFRNISTIMIFPDEEFEDCFVLIVIGHRFNDCTWWLFVMIVLGLIFERRDNSHKFYVCRCQSATGIRIRREPWHLGMDRMVPNYLANPDGMAMWVVNWLQCGCRLLSVSLNTWNLMLLQKRSDCILYPVHACQCHGHFKKGRGSDELVRSKGHHDEVGLITHIFRFPTDMDHQWALHLTHPN